MLKSALSSNLFEEFVSSYQSFTPTDPENAPFVFADSQGNIRLLTNVVDEVGGNNEIFAVSMGDDGFMEFLALQE